MFLALIGASTSLLLLGPAHDRALAKLGGPFRPSPTTE